MYQTTYDTGSPDAFVGDGETEILFTEKSIRLGFIRKVYSILMLQLLVTVAFIAICVFEPKMKIFFINNIWFFYLVLVLTFVLLIILACCPNVRRNFPINLIMLGIFTLCEAFLLGAASSAYDTQSVLLAAGVTAAVALSLTIFSFQTKWDFTAKSGLLFVALIVLMCFGLFTLIWPSKVMMILYGSLGALIFSAYLVVDTQLMMGGKHKYALSPEEYIFAALNLYLDIINIFLYLLTIFGAVKN